MAMAASLHLRRTQSRLLPELPSTHFELAFSSCPHCSNLLLFCQPMGCRLFLQGSTFHKHQLQLLVLLNMSECILLNEVSHFVTLVQAPSMSNKGLHLSGFTCHGLWAWPPDTPICSPAAAAEQIPTQCHLQSSTVSALATCPVSFCNSLGRQGAVSAGSTFSSSVLQ